MRKTALLLLALLAWGGGARAQIYLPPPPEPPAAPDPLAHSVLVVFNQNDPVSEDLARFYAKKRGVPFDQVVGLDCSLQEEILRSEYNASIAWPLRKLFGERHWWKLRAGRETDFEVVENRIRFIVLMRGMPLKIKADPLPMPLPKLPVPTITPIPGVRVPGATPTPEPTPEKPPEPGPMEREEASVDAELAVLGLFTDRLAGPMNNPYFRSFTPFVEVKLPAFMLVARLDAHSPEVVKRMIEDAIATEKNGLFGMAYADSRGITTGGYSQGDLWLESIVSDSRKHGIPVVVDRAEATYPEGYAMPHAALYYGWYAEHASGAFAPPGVRFRRGAIACHIHSFSAITLRDPLRHWAAPLLAQGAAATVGNVYEPYLDLTSHLDLLHNRLLNGFTFIEAGWMSMKTASWMNILIGDPLYRPFAMWQEKEPPGEVPPDDSLWFDYRQATRNQELDVAAPGLQQLAARRKNGFVLEGLAAWQLDAGATDESQATLRAARDLHNAPEDRARTIYHEVRAVQRAQGKEAAVTLLRQLLPGTANRPGAPALLALQRELDPPPPPPSPSPENKN